MKQTAIILTLAAAVSFAACGKKEPAEQQPVVEEPTAEQPDSERPEATGEAGAPEEETHEIVEESASEAEPEDEEIKLAMAEPAQAPLVEIFASIQGEGRFAGAAMIVESWLNARVTNSQRGQLFATYVTITMLTMSLGQYLLLVDPGSGPLAFGLSAALYSLGLVPVVTTQLVEPAPVTSGSWPRAHSRSPATPTPIVPGCSTRWRINPRS